MPERAPRSAVLFVLFAIAAALAACSDLDGLTGRAGTPDPDPDPADDGPLDAFYLVQPADLRGESLDGQPPVDLTRYTFLVCNAGLDPDEVRAAAPPSAVVLGYLNTHQVPLWGAGEFWDAYRALFQESDYWHDGDGGRSSTWDQTEEMLYTRQNAAKLAAFALQRWAGWDGIYLDDLYGELPINPVLTNLPVAEDEYEAVRAEWVVFRDDLVGALRAGTDRLLVGNVGNRGADVAHLGLDGICSEEWWPASTDAILGEFARYDARYCVAWEWDAGAAARPGEIRYR